MAIEHSITFGGVNSADFGIYISGEGVFDAPKRDVEMISIPGRNGELALDKGRYENIEVTYPAFNYEADYSDFAQNLADFRNAICSQIGYQRLSDTFHPDEYRMATYIDGLEVKPIKYNTASEFEITFNCKPQRWLTSGETPVVVTSGDTLTNPTLYESSPLLEIAGYGHIQMGDSEVDVENVPIGNVLLLASRSMSSSYAEYDTSNYNLLNDGDSITLQSGMSLWYAFQTNSSSTSDKVSSLTMTYNSSSDVAYHIGGYSGFGPSGKMGQIIFDEPVVGTKGATGLKRVVVTINLTYRMNGTTSSATFSLFVTISLSRGFISFTYSASSGQPSDIVISTPMNGVQNTDVIGFSSRGTVTPDHPLFIDCDLGEAYTIIDGEASSLNAYIDLGSDLPTLGKGANEVTYDNTITGLKISPRWWQL